MFVKCIKETSVFKPGKCYAVCRGFEYHDPTTIYHENQCDSSEVSLENFEIVRVQREEVFSYLIRENEHDCPLDVALEYSYKDGITDQFFCLLTPTQERFLLHKLEDWADAWNREP